MRIFFNKITFLLIVALAITIGWSCNIINPAEPIPAYIEIDSVSLQTTSGQGTKSQKITDAWVDIDGNQLGVYGVPKTFPVLSNGSTHVLISAGILNNGADNTRAIYPFYYPDTLTLNMQSKKIYKINPVFHYRTPTKFLLDEGFEQGISFTSLSGNDTIKRTNDPANVFEGQYSGAIILDQTHVTCESISSAAYTFPGDGSPVYIEMNYKCDMVFQVGIEFYQGVNSESIYEWTINPHDNGWNKIYLNLTDVIESLGGGSFGILILADKSISPGEGHLFLDNIKLLTI